MSTQRADGWSRREFPAGLTQARPPLPTDPRELRRTDHISWPGWPRRLAKALLEELEAEGE